MRRARWVVALTVFIIAALPLSLLVLKIGSRHPSVKRAVLARILPEFPGRLSIGGLEVGLASLSFSDVVLEYCDLVVVHVPKAIVHVSYRRLLAHGLSPRRSVDTVIVTAPRIVVTCPEHPDSLHVSGGPVDLGGLADGMPDYVGVSDATLVVRGFPSGRELTVDGIDLLVRRCEDRSIEGSLVGSAFGGTDNVCASLAWYPAGDSLEVSAELVDADLSRANVLPDSWGVAFRSGTGTAGLNARVSGDTMSSVLEFAFADAGFSLPGELGVLTEARGNGSWDGTRLSVAVKEARWEGADITGDVEIEPAERRLVRLNLTARQGSLARLASLAGISPDVVAGRVHLDVEASGPFDGVSVSFVADAKQARYRGLPIEELHLAAGWTGDRVGVRELRAAVCGGQVDASGSVARASDGGPWRLDLRGEAVDLDVARIATILGDERGAGTLDLRDVVVSGLLDRPSGEAALVWRDVAVGSVALGSGRGGVLLRDGVLTGTASSRRFAVTVTVEHVWSAPSVDAELRLAQLRVDSLLAPALDMELPVVVDGALEVRGPLGALAFDGAVDVVGPATAGSLDVEGSLDTRAAPALLSVSVESDDLTLRGVAVPFAADLSLDATGAAAARLDLPGIGEARGRVALSGDRPFRASLVVSEADLRDVIALMTGRTPPASVEGLLFASVSAGGTLARPTAIVQLQVGNARVLGVTDLDAALVADVRSDSLDLRELVVRHSGRRVVAASGTAAFDGDVAATLTGDGVPGPLLGGDEATSFDVTLGVGGRWRSPTFDARVEASSGRFVGIPFDVLAARVTGAEGLLTVERLALERSGAYRVSAFGVVPYGALIGAAQEQEGALTVEVDGDPFRLLAELVPFVEEASGHGTLRAHLVGTRDNLRVADARLSGWASRVVPSVLFEELDDVTAEVSVVDGMLVSGLVAGWVDGRAVRLESKRGLAAEGRTLPPLVVAGVDLGVLALSTDPGGVEASVPGLMASGDVGRVAAMGKEGGPAFLVAGPTERPLLWGRLEFSDASFTYPFEGAEEGFAGGFLSRAEWSLRMAAGRNLWYRRTDVNLLVEREGYLDFAGVPEEGGLCVSGRLASNRGTVTYLNNDFDVKKAFVDFPPFCGQPRFYVEASTRVEDGTTIQLTMDSYEGAFALGAPGATLDESAIHLASDSPDDDTQEKILSKLQYGMAYELLASEEQASLGRRRAIEVIGAEISGRVVRPLLSPIEGRIKRSLHLDLVRFDIDFVQHFLAQLDQWQAQEQSAEYQPFLADSRITLGKYISRDWLVSYVGFAETYEEQIGDQRLGLRHEIGIEYDVSRNTSLSVRVVYDPSLAGWDRRISIENRYEF